MYDVKTLLRKLNYINRELASVNNQIERLPLIDDYWDSFRSTPLSEIAMESYNRLWERKMTLLDMVE